MKRDLTSQSLFESIMIGLWLFIFAASVVGIVSICLVCKGDSDSFFAICVPIFVVCALVFLPSVVYHAILYKKFKKLLKTGISFYDRVEEVTYPSVFASIFFGGNRVIVNGHYSRSIYPYHKVKRLTNRYVEYILDGDTVYLLELAEDDRGERRA